ncbi:MAG TPA: XrtA system polysaccharide chain length determinant [Rhodanobacteraceae bacterium]|nr:XrtA system polysaccharide chain length determinant [Rhodanobacteraceae bacterium]
MKAEMVPLNEMAPIMISEGRRHAVALAVVSAVVALIALAVGLFWPKNYVSSTTILAQKSDIIQPLLEGRAVPTGVTDRVAIAKQVIFSRKVLEDILATGGWAAQHPDPIAQDRLLERIKDDTQITSPRESLVRIQYRDSDPDRAYKVTERLAELFIQESLAAKERESRDAYEFIDSQVEDYHKKLTSAEDNLKKYREANADAHPGSETDTNSRIATLRSGLEQSRLSMMELRSTESALSSQLSGESEITAVQTRSGIYRAQLAELQSKLDKLLLNYTDQYPDVVRTRHEMDDLRRQLQAEEARKLDPTQQKTGTPSALDATAQFNPLYTELKSKLAEVRRQIAANESRMTATEGMLNAELDRSRRIAASESALAELSRDYEVNRDIYQDLLKRRENARVSMNLDQEGRGLTFRVQDPAAKPLRPTGLSMVHFAGAGLALALALPPVLLFAFARFDPRVRSPRELERYIGVPVLASVPVYATRRERRNEHMRMLLVALLVLGVIAAYALTYLMRSGRHI